MNKVFDAVNIITDTSSGSNPFLIVEASNGKNYQVKLSNYETTSMMNEYIAYQVAYNISVNNLDATFIKFSQKQIDDSIEHMIETMTRRQLLLYNYKNYSDDNLKNDNDEIILFGIEYINYAIIAENKDEFMEYLKISNNENFYALYSYDLYLHNHDRHISNLLFYQNDNGNFISILIDHDRIFGTNMGISRISDLKTNFDCLSNGENSHLYRCIQKNNQKALIKKNAKAIEEINDVEIDNILSSYLNKCNKSILRHIDVQNTIIDFLKYRKKYIFKACQDHEENCYG